MCWNIVKIFWTFGDFPAFFLLISNFIFQDSPIYTLCEFLFLKLLRVSLMTDVIFHEIGVWA